MSGPAALVEAASKVAAAIGQSECVVIGGVCASLLGIGRPTEDVDLAALGEPEDLLNRLRSSGIEATLRRADGLDPLPWVIAGRIDGIPVQILPAAFVGDPAEATALDELGFRMLTTAQFIDAKMRAGGWRDLYDVGRLVLVHPELRAHALHVADERRVRDRFVMVLEDPRLAVDAERDKEL